MAAGAIAAKLALVQVVLLVTLDARGRRFAMFAAFLVASRARYCRVCSLQRKVGLRMRERRSLELDDVGLATLVLGVARDRGSASTPVRISRDPR